MKQRTTVRELLVSFQPVRMSRGQNELTLIRIIRNTHTHTHTELRFVVRSSLNETDVVGERPRCWKAHRCR